MRLNDIIIEIIKHYLICISDISEKLCLTVNLYDDNKDDDSIVIIV